MLAMIEMGFAKNAHFNIAATIDYNGQLLVEQAFEDNFSIMNSLVY